MENLKEKFNELLKKTGDLAELQIVDKIANKSRENMQALYDFIIEYDIDCNDLWKDNENSHKAYKDYEKLMMRTLQLADRKNINPEFLDEILNYDFTKN